MCNRPWTFRDHMNNEREIERMEKEMDEEDDEFEVELLFMGARLEGDY